MINKVILIGNLGADPEVRTTAGGTAVANLRIATTERRKDKDGNWSDHTEWHSVVVFGRTAENCGQYLKKGRQVYVEGRLQTRKWQDREGNDKYSTEVAADIVRFIGGAPREEGAGGGYSGGGGGGGSYGGGGGTGGSGGSGGGSSYGNRGGGRPPQGGGGRAPSRAPDQDGGFDGGQSDDMPYQGEDDIPF